MKKILGFFVSFLLITGLFNSTVSAASSDISGHPYEKQLTELINLEILKGYSEGVYGPNREVTRAEFASFIMRVLNEFSIDNGSEEFVTSELPSDRFSDVKSNKWYYVDVEAAAALGIVNGFDDGSFKPDNTINRQEMAMMIVNALNSRGILMEPSDRIFKDEAKIGVWALESVKKLVALQVMNGRTSGEFDPLTATTRGETAVVLSGTIKQLEPPVERDYKVAVLDTDGNPSIVRQFDTFAEAQRSATGDQVVLYNNRIVHMKSGFAIPNGKGLAEIYPTDSLKGSTTYIETGIEMKYLGTTERAVKISFGSTEGFVDKEFVNLLPTSLIKDRSYYENRDGNLVHVIYNHIKKEYGSTGIIGKAPTFLKEGQRYYSWNTIDFYSNNNVLLGREYQYFQHVPLHTKSSYSAEEIDSYFKNAYPSRFKTKFEQSPLIGMGKYIKEAEAKYEINALYFMAHAIHESEWGTSEIAQKKKNLFGYGARDGSAVDSAISFNSFEESIDFIAAKVNTNYHSPSGMFYHGAILGNKQAGMNMKYASDPYWGEKISAHMYRADLMLGNKDFNKHKLVISNEKGLRVRDNYGTVGTNTLYQMQTVGTPMIYKGQSTIDGAVWYNVVSDLKTNRNGFVYGKGPLGQYVLEIPIAQ